MSAAKKRGLGRGLDALLGMQQPTASSTPEADGGEQLKTLPVDLLERGRYQPRTGFDEEKLAELADSIRAQGVVQPIVVRPLAGGERYEIIAGERRLRACRLAGITEIPAIVRNVPDEAAMSIALIENIQREQLNPIEEARALSRLIHEFEMTHQAVADAVGRSRSAVSNLLRLLDLEETTRRFVEQGQLEMGHARALAGVAGQRQVSLAERVVAEGLSVRQTERLAKEPPGDPPPPPAPKDADVVALEERLSEQLGARVTIRHRATAKGRGKGTLTISYNSLDELEGILTHIT